MRLLVCGGAGFIGSTFVRMCVREHGDEVTVLDKLTYAGRRENLDPVSSEIRFVHGAIEDPPAVEDTVAWYRDNESWWEPIRSGAYREYYERHYGRALKD